MTTSADALHAVALCCTLSPSPAESSSQLLAEQVCAQLSRHDCACELIRLVDHDIRPGVAVDMGHGDEWPEIRRRILAADILVFATPSWLGQHSSIAQRALERLNAEQGETDDQGRPTTFGKVAVAAVVGNEDGAHKISADLFQCLDDVGFTVPAQAVTYWNGEAMHGTDFKDLPEVPDQVAETTATVARHGAHLARLLRQAPYPPA
jgi:multimeric flavodoxin WrbA